MTQAGTVGLGALELWGAIFCLIAAFLIDRGKTVEHRENVQLGYMLLLNTAILVFDMFAVTYNGEPGKASRMVLRVANLGLYFTLYVLEIYFIYYLKAIVLNNGGKFSKGFIYVGYVIMLFSIVTLIFDQFKHVLYFFDMDNYYHRGVMYGLAMVPVFACFILIFVILIFYRNFITRLQKAALIIFLSFPVLSAIFMVASGEVSSLINIGITVSLVMMYMFYEIEKNQRMLAQAEEIIKQEKINNEFKNTMLWTQIQPHFIYNNLNVIQFLCKKDPELAAEAVTHLSAYLRSYIDAYDKDMCIPIEEEMDIIKHYLYMQKLRYGDKLSVSMDIGEQAFSVPLNHWWKML